MEQCVEQVDELVIKEFNPNVWSEETKNTYNEYIKPQVIKLYQTTFAKHPYNEFFSDKAADEEISQYTNERGILYLTMNSSQKVFGFLGITNGKDGLPTNIINDMYNKYKSDVTNDLYISDLVVDSDYQNKKIGSELIKHFLDRNLYNNIFLRTSGEPDNQWVINFYTKRGFVIAEDIIQNVEQPRMDGTTTTDKRIFLYKQPPRYHDDDRYAGDGEISGNEALYG